MPLVSVAIPAYRSAPFIRATLRSVLASTLTDMEVVVADHSSDDDTATILGEFTDDPRVRLLPPTPPGGGAQANWNRVSQATHGTYIKLLPADDLITPDALVLQVEALENHPSAVLAASHRRVINARGDVLLPRRGLPSSLLGLHDGVQALRTTVRAGTNLFGEPGAVLLRRSALESAGWWDGRSGYAIDVQTYANVLALGDAYGLDETLSSFRVSNQQWSVRLAASQAAEMAAVFEGFRQAHPAEITPSDVRRGARLAWAQSMARRALYTALALRQRFARH